MTKDIVWRAIQLSPKVPFRWKYVDDIWSCTIQNRVLLLKQDDTFLHYASIPHLKDTEEVVLDYFNLSIRLEELYLDWASKDKHFTKNSANFGGIRMLRQDPWENLVSFICSTNNNVKRISQMCEKLCVHYGEFLAEYQGIKHYKFPEPERLAQPNVEAELRALGFGYRAKFIQQTAKMLTEKDALVKLYSMRTEPHKTCHEYLQTFMGVGPKVADCVCLMSLDKHDVVPVDTHVFKIATKRYHMPGKLLNKELYAQIQEKFRHLWGEYAGWAHSVLFAADLRDLNNGINIKTEK
ncbi:hypothetical protein KL929_001334 [Ogataea haglerorum]|nr:hypothetical protein KL929_001334 [Ogataea haglerorum]